MAWKYRNGKKHNMINKMYTIFFIDKLVDQSILMDLGCQRIIINLNDCCKLNKGVIDCPFCNYKLKETFSRSNPKRNLHIEVGTLQFPSLPKDIF